VSVRLAVIGCGAAARKIHLPAFRAARADIVCFASRTIASAEAAAEEWGSGDATDDWHKAIERADAVSICAPNALHAEIAIASARAGRHVLVEKPLATTLADADLMIAAARDSGTLLVPAHNARFHPAVVAARIAVAAERIGMVSQFRIALGNAGPLAWSREATWFLDPALSGGGVLLDLGVHVADIVRAVLADEIAEVAALVSGDTPVERNAVVAMRTARGATGTMDVTWDAVVPDLSLTIIGATGTLRIDNATPPVIVRVGGSIEPLELPDPSHEPYVGFVRACEGLAPPPVTPGDGRAALAFARAASRSAQTRATITIGVE